MKKRNVLVILASCLFSLPCVSYGNDYSGQWLGTITKSVNQCENIGKAELGDYKLTILHKEDEVTIMENVVQRPYTGQINVEQPERVQVKGSYNDDGGYVSEILDIHFTSDSKGSGMSTWGWSGGYYSCGGHFTFTLEKLRS